MAPHRLAVCVSAVLLVFSLISNPRGGQSPEAPEVLDGAMKGCELVYSLAYADARSAFENLRQRYPRHPGPPLYLALTLWQRELFRRHDLGLDRFVAPESFTGAIAQ